MEMAEHKVETIEFLQEKHTTKEHEDQRLKTNTTVSIDFLSILFFPFREQASGQ